MNEKMKDFLNSQIPITVLSIALGVGLIFLPAGTMGVLCRVLFGIVFMLTGGYHIVRQVMERPGTEPSMPDLYTGVVIFVLGVFLFSNPAVVLMLLPWMLGAFVIADSIWMIKACIRMQKQNVGFWKVMMIASAACIVMALILALYRFEQVRTMLTFAGWLFLLNGLADIVLTWMGKKQLLAAEAAEAADQTPQGDETDAFAAAGEEVTLSESETAAPSESGTAASFDFETAAPSEPGTAAPFDYETAAPSESGTAAPSEDEAAAPSEYETAAPSDQDASLATGLTGQDRQEAGAPLGASSQLDPPFFEVPSPAPDAKPADPAPLEEAKGDAAETEQERLPEPEPAPWAKTVREPEEPVKVDEDAKAPWESSVDPFKMQ